MKYTASHIDDTVNIPKTSPARDFFELLIKSAGALIVLYWLSGMAVNIAAPYVPPKLEMKIGKLLQNNLNKTHPSKEDSKLQTILNELILAVPSPLPKLDYSVSIVEMKDANAFALPGGKILITTGLLTEILSENELAMVLSHELGHYIHHDHLKGLGRGLIFAMLSTVFVGTDSTTTQFLSSSLSVTEMKFSQEQETAADLFALEVLYKKYRHVAGATDFFEQLAQNEKIPKFLYMLASHPHPAKRLETLNAVIKENGYPINTKLSLTLDTSYAKPKTP